MEILNIRYKDNYLYVDVFLSPLEKLLIKCEVNKSIDIDINNCPYHFFSGGYNGECFHCNIPRDKIVAAVDLFEKTVKDLIENNASRYRIASFIEGETDQKLKNLRTEIEKDLENIRYEIELLKENLKKRRLH